MVKEAFINYGVFLQHLFDFLIVALAVFFPVKVINRAKAMAPAEEAAPAAPKAPPEDIQLLREIRDALAK